MCVCVCVCVLSPGHTYTQSYAHQGPLRTCTHTPVCVYGHPWYPCEHTHTPLDVHGHGHVHGHPSERVCECAHTHRALGLAHGAHTYTCVDAHMMDTRQKLQGWMHQQGCAQTHPRALISPPVHGQIHLDGWIHMCKSRCVCRHVHGQMSAYMCVIDTNMDKPLCVEGSTWA